MTREFMSYSVGVAVAQETHTRFMVVCVFSCASINELVEVHDRSFGSRVSSRSPQGVLFRTWHERDVQVRTVEGVYMDASPIIVALLVAIGLVSVVTLVIVIWFLVKLIKTARLVRDTLMPLQGKIAFWGAIAYSISPVDLLADPIYLDDIGIVVMAIAYIHNLAEKHGIKRRYERREISLPDTSTPSGYAPPIPPRY